jgi:hypothetical protein
LFLNDSARSVTAPVGCVWDSNDCVLDPDDRVSGSDNAVAGPDDAFLFRTMA